MKTRTFYNPASLFLAATLATSLTAASALAQINLPVGGAVTPPAVNVGGTVISDDVIPFQIFSAGGALLYSAALQDRVIRTGSNDLTFKSLIRNNTPGLNGIISRIDRVNFSSYTTAVNSSPSIAGVAPVLATRSGGTGDNVQWRFGGGGIPSSTVSTWMDINTNSEAYNMEGLTIITLTTGESIAIPTAHPGAGDPTGVITGPAPFSCVCSPINITGTANVSSGGGFDSYSLHYSTSPTGPWTTIVNSTTPVTNGTLANWNTAAVPSGNYFIRLTVRNISGDTTTAISLVSVDSGFESLELRSPVNGGLYGGTVCFDGTATDRCFSNYTLQYRPSGTPNYITFVNSATAVINDPLGSLAAGGFADGTYDVRLTGTDICGQSQTITRRIGIDNTVPISTIRSPINCDTVAGVVPIIGTAFDANISGWSLSVTGGPYNDFVTIATGTTNIINDVIAAWDTTELPQCCYTLRLTVVDRALVNCSTNHRTDYYVSVDLADPLCGADFNNDGGIDGSDVEAFLTVWENGGCLP